MELLQTIPVLRIFDLGKAREFYLDFLGFGVDWEHRFEPGGPVYMQISCSGCVLHLSEHHGDGCCGAVVFVRVRGLTDYHRQISAKGYRHLRPGVEPSGHGSMEMVVIDPFGNRIRFDESANPVP